MEEFKEADVPTTKEILDFMKEYEMLCKAHSCRLAGGTDINGKIIFTIRKWDSESTSFNS